jgi:hypothetical protein
MFKTIRSRKLVLPLSLLMLWTATPAQADDWSHDDLLSDITSRILSWISSADLSMVDEYIPKPPPPPGTPEPEESKP